MTDLERKWFGLAKEARDVYRLGDFQRAAAKMSEAVGEAYNAAIHLKGMWDTFESIPEKQQPLYDQTVRVMSGLNQPRNDAGQVAENLKRYR